MSYSRAWNNGWSMDNVQPELCDHSCWPVTPCLGGHVVHSWTNNEILNCKSLTFNLFFYYDLSHKNTSRYFARMAKNFLLAVCYTLWGYPLRKIFGHSNCCYPLEKKYLLEQHWFFNSEFKTIQPWNSGSFHMAKGIQSDAAFCDVLDLSYCHTFVTEHLSFGIAVYFNGFTVQKLTTKTPKWNVLLDCQVVSNLDTMGLQDVKTHIFQSALFPSSWKRNIEHEASLM